MSLRSKTHAALLPRCYAHGGFNNRIPTISQAYYRNFLCHIYVEFFFFIPISHALRIIFANDERRRRYRSEPTTLLYVFLGNLGTSRSCLIIPTCSCNMATCNLGLNVTMRRLKTGYLVRRAMRKRGHAEVRVLHPNQCSVYNCKTLSGFDSRPTHMCTLRDTYAHSTVLYILCNQFVRTGISEENLLERVNAWIFFSIFSVFSISFS